MRYVVCKIVLSGILSSQWVSLRVLFVKQSYLQILFLLMFILMHDPVLAQDPEVIRKTWIVRGSDYTQSVFYSGDKEIAQKKSSPRGVYEEQGQIPDGKVKFFNESNKTYGEEHYKRGKKDGPELTFYEMGELKVESNYKEGKLQNSKEYYKNGKLRFEVDYADARESGDPKEAGVGKLYFKDGTLKYEWNFTKSNRTGFRKSYNYNGELTFEAYYDENGRLIDKTKQ